MDNNEKLTKLYVSFGARGGESMWAKTIEGDLFVIQNLPFFAFGLNFGDVVRAPEIAGLRQVQAVVRASGHRTLRIIFGEHVALAEQVQYLDALADLGASYERATDRLVAIDAPPTAHFDAIIAALRRWEVMGELDVETCEQRVPGSFDDASEDWEQ